MKTSIITLAIFAGALAAGSLSNAQSPLLPPDKAASPALEAAGSAATTANETMVDALSASDKLQAIPSPTSSDPSSAASEESDLEEPAPIPPPADIMVDPTAATGAPGTGTTSGSESFDGTPVLDLNTSQAGAVVDFQEEDLPQVLRLLARQAKVNLYVSDAVQGMITIRVQNKTPMETLRFIVQAKGLVLDEVNGDYFIKTQAEKASEPTESAFYTFSYARADEAAALLASQLASKAAPQVDTRTNTVFYQEVVSNLDNIKMFLETIDKPTKQVMIEARLVEVTANKGQDYGINWTGSLLNKQVGLSGSSLTSQQQDSLTINRNSSFTGTPIIRPDGTISTSSSTSRTLTDEITNLATSTGDFLLDPNNLFSTIGGQYAILTAPQLSATLSLINQDDDAEFLAQPRIVTADNQEATIRITRNQPVPQLNFNEQTATAVFGGFEDKEFGNTLTVRPSINKDDFITLNVKPEVSNKVGDAQFTFAGATVASPIIDTRTLESNILIKSGNTLAIGGLLQDETGKSSTKVPVLGDIPVLGYMFQSKSNVRVKRNLLVFVTPTIIAHGEGTGLENQVSGLHDSGEEYADPNGWRNNARGAVRLVPTSNTQRAGDYPKPGTPLQPRKIDYKSNAKTR